ncbi:hypothetical protein CDD83_5636 [Cordyceps sp. RAO-2017]|nr:hypothetical protein CDD83_5636 [Cordyceps sp. RAO-2017]
MTQTTVALFGANGNIGNAILHALASCQEREFKIIAFVRPNASLRYRGDARAIVSLSPDLATVSVHDLSPMLLGVDVVFIR